MKLGEPKTFIQGETLSWMRSFDDYLYADGWNLKYYFRGSSGNGFDVVAVSDVGDFITTIPSSVTANCTPGKYSYQAFLEKDDEKILAASGTVEVKAGLATIAAGANFDGRTQNEITLDAIRACLAKKATLDQQEYAIGTRSLRRIPIPELIQLEQLYAQRVGRERTAEQLRKGGKFFKTVLVRQRD